MNLLISKLKTIDIQALVAVRILQKLATSHSKERYINKNLDTSIFYVLYF